MLWRQNNQTATSLLLYPIRFQVTMKETNAESPMTCGTHKINVFVNLFKYILTIKGPPRALHT